MLRALRNWHCDVRTKGAFPRKRESTGCRWMPGQARHDVQTGPMPVDDGAFCKTVESWGIIEGKGLT